MEIRDLQYFISVAEELGIREAAKRIGISQPSVTRSIATLEDELGLDLFVRHRGRISGLTTAGSHYLDNARQILRSFDYARQSAYDIAEGKTGRLRLGVCDDATTNNLARILTAFCASLPTVTFDLLEFSSPEQANAIRRNEIDIGIISTPVDDRGLVVETLWSENWFAAFSPEHQFGDLDHISCSDLSRSGLILAHPQLAPGGHDGIRSAFLAANIYPNVAVQALRRSTMIMLAASGVGVTFVPAAVAAVSLPGLGYRPFTSAPLTITAAFRAADPPGLAMQFLRIAHRMLAT